MINGLCRFQEGPGLFFGKAAGHHPEAGTKQQLFTLSKSFFRQFRGAFLQNLIGFSRALLRRESLAGDSRLRVPLPFPSKQTCSYSSVFFLILALSFCFPACSRDQGDLQYRVRQQAATIQSLNQEIQRLNDEILQLLSAQEAVQKENAAPSAAAA